MYGGWHFSADAEGCASLLRLIELLSAEVFSAHRTLVITDPQPVGADRIFGKHEFQLEVPKKLRLCCTQSADEGAVHFLDDILVIPLKPQDIPLLSEPVGDVARDHADFGVGFGKDQTVVRFWWWPKRVGSRR